MKASTYFLVSGFIFSLVALAHLARILLGLPIVLGSDFLVPMWLSWFGTLVPGFLAVSAFRLVLRD